eukprot:PDM67161.1 hypothetical protein PRIPAC_48578 [Pristionchus pacificus]
MPTNKTRAFGLHLLLAVDVDVRQLLEVGAGNVGDESVELVGKLLYNAKSYILPDSLGPDSLVEAGVDTDVLGLHLELGELADLVDRARRTSLEGPQHGKVVVTPYA